MLAVCDCELLGCYTGAIEAKPPFRTLSMYSMHLVHTLQKVEKVELLLLGISTFGLLKEGRLNNDDQISLEIWLDLAMEMLYVAR